MHSVELLEQALAAAKSLGYGIRHEYLGDIGGAACEIAGRKWLFVDLALNTSEQLGEVLEALRQDSGVDSIRLSAELAHALGVRRAA